MQMTEFWKDATEIKFISTVPGVSDMFPIRPMSEYRPMWPEKAKADYLNVKLDTTKRNTHITLCPGIFDLFKVGYYVSMWYDVYVKTEKGKPGFSWRVATPDMTTMSEMNIIDTHGDMITKHIPKRDGRIDNIVKINTPYHVISPVKLLFLPMPYPDHFDYESSSGILDSSVSTELNVQLHLNVEEGERFIKAGTPLMQIIPLTHEHTKMICTDANEKELDWIKKRRYFNSFSFSPVRKKIQSLYKRYFK